MGGRADPDERIAGADPPLQRLAAQMRLEPFPQKGRAAVMDRTQPGNGGGGIGERVGGNRVGDQDFRVARHLSRSSTPARRRSSLRLTPPQNLVRTDSRISRPASGARSFRKEAWRRAATSKRWFAATVSVD